MTSWSEQFRQKPVSTSLMWLGGVGVALLPTVLIFLGCHWRHVQLPFIASIAIPAFATYLWLLVLIWIQNKFDNSGKK